VHSDDVGCSAYRLKAPALELRQCPNKISFSYVRATE